MRVFHPPGISPPQTPAEAGTPQRRHGALRLVGSPRAATPGEPIRQAKGRRADPHRLWSARRAREGDGIIPCWQPFRRLLLRLAAPERVSVYGCSGKRGPGLWFAALALESGGLVSDPGERRDRNPPDCTAINPGALRALREARLSASSFPCQSVDNAPRLLLISTALGPTQKVRIPRSSLSARNAATAA